MKINYSYTEVTDGSAMIYTYTVHFWKGVVFNMAVFGIIFTLIFVLVSRRKR